MRESAIREDEMAIRWDDPDIAIDWPIESPVLSKRDAQAICLRNVPSDRLFD